MKVLLFSEGMNLIKISGLGRAIMHQQKALKLNGIEYTLDPKDDYDVVHINTLGLKSKALAKKAKKNGVGRVVPAPKTYSLVICLYFSILIFSSASICSTQSCRVSTVIEICSSSFCMYTKSSISSSSIMPSAVISINRS